MQPLVLYLDQNKWIQFSKYLYGKEKSIELDRQIPLLIELIEQGVIVVPLAASHYMELIRISSTQRYKRLARIMVKYSKGNRFASNEDIVRYEASVALKKIFPEIKELSLKLIGQGRVHWMGYSTAEDGEADCDEDIWLSEYKGQYIKPKYPSVHRENFQELLGEVRQYGESMSESVWLDRLVSLAIGPVAYVIDEVCANNDIPIEKISSIEKIRFLASEMPSRKLDVHLHTQVVKNPTLKTKLSDLEDWSGLSLGVLYADFVCGERGFLSLCEQDSNKVNAKLSVDFSIVDEIADILKLQA